MKRIEAKLCVRRFFICIGLVTLVAGAIAILCATFSFHLNRVQAADTQAVLMEGGVGEVTGCGETRKIIGILDPEADTDGDGITDGEEGEGSIEGTYVHDAYNDDTLCTLETEGGWISIKIDKGHLRKVHTMPDNDPNRPEKSIDDPEFPYGFISFRIEGLNPDSNEEKEVKLELLFPEDVSAHAVLYRYHLESWRAQIGYSIGDASWKYDFQNLSEPYKKQGIIVTIKDNDSMYDSDRPELRDGEIEGIWGLGVPKDSEDGRCFIQALP
ncbi:MAG: hypothetical protein AB1847_17190 [bacterium]